MRISDWSSDVCSSDLEKVSIDYPIGHRKRRGEGIPVLMDKCEKALRAHLAQDKVDRLMALAADPATLDALPVSVFMQLYQKSWPCSAAPVTQAVTAPSRLPYKVLRRADRNGVVLEKSG